MTARYIHGAEKAARVAADLVLESIYFECTPFPDEFYEFWVEYDVLHRLEALSLEFRKSPGLFSPTRRQLMEVL